MPDADVVTGFRVASEYVKDAIGALEALRLTYALSRLPQTEKLARVAAINAKIDYLAGLGLDGNQHPWCGDML